MMAAEAKPITEAAEAVLAGLPDARSITDVHAVLADIESAAHILNRLTFKSRELIRKTDMNGITLDPELTSMPQAPWSVPGRLAVTLTSLRSVQAALDVVFFQVGKAASALEPMSDEAAS